VVRNLKACPTTILLTTELINLVNTDVNKHGHGKERGGILLGLRRGPHLHINEATLPMRWDISTRFSFRRASMGHEDVAIRRWRQSKQTMDWVGEWHSHPEKIPSPSNIDIRSWIQITRNRGAPMAFLILGWEGGWLGLCIPDSDTPITYKEVERSDAGSAYQPAY